MIMGKMSCFFSCEDAALEGRENVKSVCVSVVKLNFTFDLSNANL